MGIETSKPGMARWMHSFEYARNMDVEFAPLVGIWRGDERGSKSKMVLRSLPANHISIQPSPSY